MDWKERARGMSEVLLSELCSGVTCNMKLVQAVRDIFVTFEKVIANHEDEIRKLREWKQNVEIRIENEKREDDSVVEQRVPERHVPTESSAPVEHDRGGAHELYGEGIGKADEEKHCSDSSPAGNAIARREEANESVRKENELAHVDDGGVMSEIEACTTNTSSAKIALGNRKRPHAEARESSDDGEIVALPTWSEARDNVERKRKRRRTLENLKPFPCAKCRVRKRAVMLRLHGRVDEDAFQKWAGKRGNCLEYMHIYADQEHFSQEHDSLDVMNRRDEGGDGKM